MLASSSPWFVRGCLPGLEQLYSGFFLRRHASQEHDQPVLNSGVWQGKTYQPISAYLRAFSSILEPQFGQFVHDLLVNSNREIKRYCTERAALMKEIPHLGIAAR